MRSVFQVNTVYQLFISINMRLNKIPEGEVDIIVTDHTPILKNYVKNLGECGLFNKVYYVESLVFNREFWAVPNDKKADFFYNSSKNLGKVYSEPQIDYSQYDNIFLANLDAYSKFVYREYPHININLIEDGASICTNDWRKATERWNYIQDFNIVYNNVDKLYLYSPDLMCVELGYEMIELPQIDIFNKDVVSIYNKIFDYDESFKFPRFVFLEEPFYADNIKNNDLELMKIISEEVGYENYFIKTHPRNTYNRSKVLGLAKQQNTPWPFEVMLMNAIYDDVVFITVDSGALISTRAVFKQDIKTIFLYKIIEGPTRNIAVKEFEEYMDKFCDKFASKNMMVPLSKREFRCMLRCLREKGDKDENSCNNAN